MRSELKSKFIQHLHRIKASDEGFTLIELLVVIIIIGILSAIAIPNFLNQDVKAKQTEAKQNVALVNKTQNSYRAENTSFATSFNILAIGSVSGVATGTTNNYSYTISGTTDTATVTATPIDAALKGFSGGTTRFKNGAEQSVTGSVLCQMLKPGVTATAPTVVGGDAGSTPTCLAADHTTLSI